MPDGLTLAIGADTSRMRAELAVAQSALRAFTREMNAAANQARKSGSDLSFAQTAQAAANVNHVTDEIAKLKQELGGLSQHARNIESVTELFRLMPGVVLRARELLGVLREGVEAAVAAFAVEKVAEWAKHMAEAGEAAVHTAAAVGLPLQSYLDLAGAMQLAGGNAENATRALVMLQGKMQQAVAAPDSTSMDAFSRAGISFEKLHEALVSGDVKGILGDLADTRVRMGELGEPRRHLRATVRRKAAEGDGAGAGQGQRRSGGRRGKGALDGRRQRRAGEERGRDGRKDQHPRSRAARA